MVHDFTQLAERYVAAWNETDADARRRCVADLWSRDGRLVDPMVDVAGPEASADTIGAVQQQFPGFVCRLTGPVDGHHEQFRFRWELGPRGEEAPIAGSDVVTLDPAGRLHTVFGFLDRVPGA